MAGTLYLSKKSAAEAEEVLSTELTQQTQVVSGLKTQVSEAQAAISREQQLSGKLRGEVRFCLFNHRLYR